MWFDQNELRGGDSWDAKIRKQIRDCALFLPVISACTQDRSEGYFRREWRLGVERTHDMAGGVAFIMPVVIDETPESESLVPEEFMRVQWTRLPRGIPSPEFVAQVKRLLEKRSTPARSAPPMRSEPAVAAPRKKSVPGWTWGALTAVVVGIGVALSVSHQSAPLAPPVTPAAETKPAPTPPAAPKISDKSIAVLPFTNMSEEKDSAFFADGIHEDILTNLALVRELHVVSRTSVMQYRATTKPIRQIGEELGVAYILEGSVRRAGNKVRVTGQLINARTDEHAWAKAYDRDITDIFGIQCRAFTGDCPSSGGGDFARGEIAARAPADGKSRGLRCLPEGAAIDSGFHRGIVGIPDRRIALEKAVALDPNFAAAWGELGRQYAFVYFSEVDRSAERLVLAREAIENAIRLAPDAPEVIEKYGDYFYYAFRDYSRAAEQYRRLAVLRPNDAVVFGSLGLIHRRQGRMRESLTELRRAVELEPRNMRYLNSLRELAQALNLYDEATALQQRVVGLSPGDLFEQATLFMIPFNQWGSTKEGNAWLAQAKADKDQPDSLMNLRKQWALSIGNWAEAIRLDGVQRYVEIPTFSHAAQDVSMACVLAVQGDRSAARARATEVIHALKKWSLEQKPSATVWSTLSNAYAITGEREEALRCGRKAMELVPESTDAVVGPGFQLQLCGKSGVARRQGGGTSRNWPGCCVRLMAKNIYAAKYGVAWWPLHGDPRFEKLVNDPANNAPLF